MSSPLVIEVSIVDPDIICVIVIILIHLKGMIIHGSKAVLHRIVRVRVEFQLISSTQYLSVHLNVAKKAVPRLHQYIEMRARCQHPLINDACIRNG